ncbi:MAG: class I SAM-dependent methyltransferase [Salaquimonas sp.]
MSDKSPDEMDQKFEQRRDDAREEINAMDKSTLHDQTERRNFFNAVYANAKGDSAYVPWADLKPKDKLDQWLKENSRIKVSHTLAAMDVACGLGDNAEALANAGYKTTAFDLAEDAIAWAKKRFPETKVEYQKADLFDLPQEWKGAFDLVHECYTLQALPPDMLEKSAATITSLVKPGGTLLVFTRTRLDEANVEGPPWPLEQSATMLFKDLGFELVRNDEFQNQKNGRVVPHAFMEWRKI